MTEEEEFRRLHQDWQVKWDALLGFPMFTNGWMILARLPEHERLVAKEREAKQALDAFSSEYSSVPGGEKTSILSAHG